MAQAFSSIIGTLASSGTIAFHYQIDRLMAQREADCATGILNARYIAYNVGGSGSGGGGTGAVGNPYLCRHFKDVADLIGANDVDNVGWYLNKGDTFDGRGGVATLTIGGDNCLLGAYGSGVNPVLSDFTPENTLVAGVWTHAAGVYTKTFTAITITWIRKDEAPSVNLEVGTEKAWVKFGSAVACAANADTTINAWFQDTTTKLVTVKTVSDVSPAGVVQMSRSQVIGIHGQSYGLKIQGLTILGFGIQENDNGQSQLLLEIDGTNTVAVIDCNLYYTCAHAGLAYNNQAGLTGGYSLWKNIKCGYCIRPFSVGPPTSYGNPVPITHFNGGTTAGLQEFYCQDIDVQYGALPYDPAATGFHDAPASFAARSGYGIYCHTNGATTVALAVGRNITVRNHVFGCETNSFFGDLPLPNNHADAASYRGFMINETTEGGTGCVYNFVGTNIIRINDNLVSKPSSGFGTGTAGGYFATGAGTGMIAIGGKWVVDYSGLGAGNFGFRNGNAPIGRKNVTAVSVANPSSLTSTAHGFTTGTVVKLGGFATTPDINGAYSVTRVDADHFTIPVTVTAVSDGVGTAELFDRIMVVGLHLEVTCSGSNSLAFDGTNDSSTCSSKDWRWFNAIVSNNANAGCNAQQFSKNQAAGVEVSDIYTKGMTNCAFFRSDGLSSPANIYKSNFNAPSSGEGVAGAWWGVGSTGGYVELTAKPTVGATPASGGQLFQVGTGTLPFAIQYWIDANKVIRMMPTIPSIGPIQPKTFSVGRGTVNGRTRHRRLSGGLVRS